jgi:hypothetical protein
MDDAQMPTAASERLLSDIAERIAREPDYVKGNSAPRIVNAVSEMLKKLEMDSIVACCTNPDTE